MGGQGASANAAPQATCNRRPTEHVNDTSRSADRPGLAAVRLIVGSTAGGIAAALALSAGATWSVAALTAWDVAAVVYVTWVWLTVFGADATSTARHARAEDAPRGRGRERARRRRRREPGGRLVHAPTGRSRPRPRAATASVIGSVALAWISVHTVYLLRYARLYYTPPDGGIDFHGQAPDYRDFAYLALTIGMTFQVSDADLLGKRARRTALDHALLSYVFGTVIVAITVSSVAGRFGASWTTSRTRGSPERSGGRCDTAAVSA